MATTSLRPEAHRRRTRGPSAFMMENSACGADSQCRASSAAQIQTPTMDLNASASTVLRPPPEKRGRVTTGSNPSLQKTPEGHY
eukprot:2912547-Pyramimonas_sp.AAC.1